MIFACWFFAASLFIQASASWAADTVRIAYSSINPHALLVSLAEKRGLFAKYGLSSVVVYIPGGSTVVQAMVSGMSISDSSPVPPEWRPICAAPISFTSR